MFGEPIQDRFQIRFALKLNKKGDVDGVIFVRRRADINLGGKFIQHIDDYLGVDLALVFDRVAYVLTQCYLRIPRRLIGFAANVLEKSTGLIALRDYLGDDRFLVVAAPDDVLRVALKGIERLCELIVMLTEQLAGHRVNVGHYRTEPQRQHRCDAGGAVEQLRMGLQVLRGAKRAVGRNVTYQRGNVAFPDYIYFRRRIPDAPCMFLDLHISGNDPVHIDTAAALCILPLVSEIRGGHVASRRLETRFTFCRCGCWPWVRKSPSFSLAASKTP